MNGITWRLIDDDLLSGSENMARDEALLRSFEADVSQPVLRLYGWLPPAFSIGRFQNADEVLDLELCHAERVPVVRRITGGGVIYHSDELTYSITCSTSQIPAADSIKDSFRILTGFLLHFYRKLGLNGLYAADCAEPGEKLGARVPFCYAGRETFDITINGRKIGGNAQRRQKRIIFQHGSIPVADRVAAGVRFLRTPPAGVGQITTCLEREGVALGRRELGSLLRISFSEYFGAALTDDSLCEKESRLAASLKHDKYLSGKWNVAGESI